jgi:hypothetical protein
MARPGAEMVQIALILDYRSNIAVTERARLDGVLQETLRPARLERSFSPAVDQIAEALPLTSLLFAHGR